MERNQRKLFVGAHRAFGLGSAGHKALIALRCGVEGPEQTAGGRIKTLTSPGEASVEAGPQSNTDEPTTLTPRTIILAARSLV
jgi:hypothetical protein